MSPRRSTNEESTKTQPPAPDPVASVAAAINTFDEEFKNLNLQGKIATISGYIGRLPKNGYNKFNAYHYVLESDLVEAVRTWLAAARILIYPDVESWSVTQGVESERRSGDARTDILFRFNVVDGRTAETFSFTMLGQGSDPRDKGANKASTSAMKFAYMRLFNLSSGEDPENDAAGDQAAAGQAPVSTSVALRPMAEDTKGVTSIGETSIEASNVTGALRGGKQEKANGAQIRMVSQLSNQLSLGAEGLVLVIKRVLNDDIELPEEEAKHATVLAAYLRQLEAEDIGRLIYTLQQTLKAGAGD